MTIRPDLDGKYTVTTQSGYDGPLEKLSDGFTVIKGGKTVRMDGAGCEWHSTFEWVGDDTVKMTSRVDTTNADPDFLLIGPDGRPTYDSQAYETLLKTRLENGLPVMSGTLNLGDTQVILTLRRVKD